MSGNRFFFIASFIAALSGCSPKTTTPPVKRPDQPGELPKQEQPKVVELKPAVNSIALILPFNLDKVDARSASAQQIGRSEIALDFYQGFLLAIDSLKAQGYHFRVDVLDSRNDEAKVAELAKTAVSADDLIIGPIFPDNIKVFSEAAGLKDKLQVSPLAASMPSQFNNPHLVTINNSIDQHGFKIAEYIHAHYPIGKTHVVLINTRTSDSEKFAAPVRKQLNALSGGRLKITEVANAKGIESNLSKNLRNVVIIASDDQKFVVPTINRLSSLTKSYKIDVFGHPNLSRILVDTEQLQRLNTIITSSYTVDYESKSVGDFVAKYHSEYKLDPSEYAFKGFDTGYYFGALLGEFGKEYVKNMDREYKGLHNNFKFSYDSVSGFRNTAIKLLKYEDYELREVQ